MTLKKDATDQWQGLDISLDEDILTEAYSDEEVDAAIRAQGGDPGAIGYRGVALGRRLLDAQRLSWMAAARRKQEEMRTIVSAARPVVRRSRVEMMDILAAARADPHLQGRIEGFWRKRRPEESSTEELGELVEEIEALKRLVEADKEPGQQ